MPKEIAHPYQFEFKGCWVLSFKFIQILKVGNGDSHIQKNI